MTLMVKCDVCDHEAETDCSECTMGFIQTKHRVELNDEGCFRMEALDFCSAVCLASWAADRAMAEV